MSRLSPGLGALVDYLHLLEESEEELAESHLGDRDAVSVMTIPQAKVSNGNTCGCLGWLARAPPASLLTGGPARIP